MAVTASSALPIVYKPARIGENEFIDGGMRGNTSIEDRTLYDLHYVENWSLGLDVRILLMTIHHVLRGENAY